VTRLGEVLCGHATAAATSHDNDVGFNRFWLVPRRELQKLILETVGGFAMNRQAWEPQNWAYGWTGDNPTFLNDGGESSVNGAERRQARRVPSTHNRFPEFHRLVLDWRGGTRYNQRAGTGVERSQDKPEAIPSLVMHIVAQESLRYGPELRV
jgi:hypothetical protein